jgi:hypothetical protein
VVAAQDVNLFVIEPPTPTPAQLERAQALLAPFRAELGLAKARPWHDRYRLRSWCGRWPMSLRH